MTQSAAARTDRSGVPAGSGARTSLSCGAEVWANVVAELDRVATAIGIKRVNVLDVGGGSGQVAVPIAALGFTVTVVDPSPDALASLGQRAAGAGVAERIRPVAVDAGSLRDVVPVDSQHLVLCHNVLEFVDDPAATLGAVAAVLTPGGALSALVANRHAVVLAKLVAGQISMAARALADPDGRLSDTDPVLRRWSTDQLCDQLARAGMSAEQVRGVRAVSDLVPSEVIESDLDAVHTLAEIEAAVAGTPPFRDLAAQLHALGRKARRPVA